MRREQAGARLRGNDDAQEEARRRRRRSRSRSDWGRSRDRLAGHRPHRGPVGEHEIGGLRAGLGLSPELAQIVVGPGLDEGREPDGGDLLLRLRQRRARTRPASRRWCRRRRRDTEAQKTEPDKNTYLVFKKGLPGRGLRPTTTAPTSSSRGTRPAIARATSRGSTSTPTPTHRVTRLATQDKNGNPIADIDGSTWDPFAQRLLFTTENAERPTYAATPGYPSTVDDVSGALGRGGYEGIQDDSDGNIWIVEDIGGANKPGTTAKIPNSFVYRYVPEARATSHNGRLQVAPGLNAARHADHHRVADAAQRPPTRSRCTPTATSFDTRWVTIHDTAIDGTAPFNANAAAKAARRHAVQAARERRCSGRARSSSEFFFDETGDTNATSAGEQQLPAAGAALQADPGRPVGGHREADAVLQGRPGARRLRQRRVPRQGPDHVRRGRRRHAARRSATRSTRASSSTSRRTTRTPANQSAPLARRGPRRVGDDRRRPTAASARTTATTRSPASTSPTATPARTGSSARRSRTCSSDGMALVFYTQQHGDNPTYEVIRPKK